MIAAATIATRAMPSSITTAATIPHLQGAVEAKDLEEEEARTQIRFDDLSQRLERVEALLHNLSER